MFLLLLKKTVSGTSTKATVRAKIRAPNASKEPWGKLQRGGVTERRTRGRNLDAERRPMAVIKLFHYRQLLRRISSDLADKQVPLPGFFENRSKAPGGKIVTHDKVRENVMRRFSFNFFYSTVLVASVL